MTGMPIHSAYGCNKLQSGFGTTISAYRYWKSGMIDIKIVLISAFCCNCLILRSNEDRPDIG